MPTLVTQPYLPPLEEYIPYLQKIWDSKWLTNNGQFHQQLEQKLAEFLGVPYLCLFNNGTIALLTALQALDIKGEVITTPFTFVATSHALLWNNITPVFVDISSDDCNLDPSKIEAAITDKTTAILPVHVYGNPCHHLEIKHIAERHNLKLIYDAAHAFGVQEDGHSILNYGDLSILSFHATKVFNTFEGGAIICHSKEMKQHIDDLKNFGFRGETEVVLPGINGKMNEVQAAMGLVQLQHFEQVRQKRMTIYEYYNHAFQDTKGVSVIPISLSINHNAAYYPIFIDAETYGEDCSTLYQRLKENDIYARRYFYPLVTEFEAYKGLTSINNTNLPIAKKKSEEVLCLPIYPDLEMEEVRRIVGLINNK